MPKGKKNVVGGATQKKASKSSVPRPLVMTGERLGLANGVVQSGALMSWAFEKAPAHDLYPLGGLRVCGILPGSATNTDLVTNDTAAVGGWTNAGIPGALVTPTGAYITGQTTSMFSATGPLAVLAQFFRQYRCRALDLVYTSSVSPADTTYSQKNVQVAYERDPVTVGQLAATYTQASAVTDTCTRFPAWTPSLEVPLIKKTQASRDDVLFWSANAGDAIAAASDSEQRQMFQGGVTCTINSVGGADTVLGTVLWRFCFDFYGWTNVATDVLPLLSRGFNRHERGIGDSRSDVRDECSGSPTPGAKDDEGFVEIPQSIGALQQEIAALRCRLETLAGAARDPRPAK